MITAPAAPHESEPQRSLLVAVWHHPVTRFALYFALVAATLVLLSILGQSLIYSGSYLGRHAQIADILGSFIEPVSVAGWLALMLYAVERRRMGDAGYTLRGITTETISGSLIGMAFISVVIGLLAFCGAYRVYGTNAHFHPWLPLFAYLLVAISEETIFRGYLLRIMEYRYGSLIGVIVSSLVFGLIHLLNLVQLHIPFWQGLVGALSISVEAGVPLALAYIATRRLWLPIGIHWAWNYFESPIYGVADSGTTNPNTLYRSSLHGPFFLSGGGFGPEASVICVIVGLILSVLLLRVAVRAGQWKPAGEWKPQSEPRLTAPASG